MGGGAQRRLARAGAGRGARRLHGDRLGVRPGEDGRRGGDAGAARRARDRAGDHEPADGGTPLGPDDAAFATQLAALDADAAFSRAIGCTRFQLVFGPTTPTGSRRRERWSRCGAGCRRSATVLARHDVRLGLEFLGPLVFRAPARGDAPAPVPFVWTLRETLALCEASAPNVGVTLDAWHWHHSGGTVADIRAANVSRIVHVHVSDARAMPPSDVRDDMRLLPGEGMIDLVGFFQALQAIGYGAAWRRRRSARASPHGMPPDESARIALAATVAVMRKAGVG